MGVRRGPWQAKVVENRDHAESVNALTDAAADVATDPDVVSVVVIVRRKGGARHRISMLTAGTMDRSPALLLQTLLRMAKLVL